MRHLPVKSWPLATVLAFGLLLATAGSTSAGCYDYTRLDKAFARKTNAARVDKSVGKLKLDPHLARVARYHTKEMIRKGELVHTPIAKLGRRVTRWVALAENIGVGGSVKSLHRAFMKSAGHRANILNSAYEFFGIGAIKKGKKIWITAVFEAKRNPGTRLKMPSC
ncbi:MAG: CAP domain-containing protein [Actinomycetota bacterium]